MGFPTKRHRRAADRLTAKYGGAAVLVRLDVDGIGPGGIPNYTRTEYDVQAIETGSREAFGIAPGYDAGDRLGVINVLDTGVTPQLDDELIAGGETLRLREIEPVQPNPGEPAILFRYLGKKVA